MYVFSITNQTLTCQTITACQSIVSPGGFGNELTAISAFLSAMLAERWIYYYVSMHVHLQGVMDSILLIWWKASPDIFLWFWDWGQVFQGWYEFGLLLWYNLVTRNYIPYFSYLFIFWLPFFLCSSKNWAGIIWGFGVGQWICEITSVDEIYNEKSVLLVLQTASQLNEEIFHLQSLSHEQHQSFFQTTGIDLDNRKEVQCNLVAAYLLYRHDIILILL